jgi:hypothetical protein
MKAKIGAIFLISMIALAGTGAAYALWYEDLYIYTYIETGDFDVRFSFEGTWEEEIKPEISWSDGYWDEFEDTNYLYWNIYNAYPCVHYYLDFNIECIGSIPAHFTDPIINTNLPADSFEYDLFYTDGGPVDWSQIQIHQGDIIYLTLRLHFNNEIEENMDYYFDLYTMAHQYNENPPI